ncbi:class I SAM-dependent methyltransferase [Devosia sp. ZB163]|uniref:class I SAM-dependent methyltransferase n=1 Tax=Devosia sp. ZB163 TaxID=3025938 RepID=UPI0030811FD3
MNRSVSYDRQTIASPNPLARFAHRSRHRLSLALLEKHAPAGGLIVDFGAGTGEMLHQLGRRRSDLRRVAIEPYMQLLHADVSHLPNLASVEPRTVDVLTAFEVLEHLTDHEIAAFIADVSRTCKPGATLIVSVPIMQGLALPLKELNRVLLFRRPSDYSARDVLQGLFGRQVRRATDVRHSHKGFDHRALRVLLQGAFDLRSHFSAPLAALPWWANSQSFLVFSVR